MPASSKPGGRASPGWNDDGLDAPGRPTSGSSLASTAPGTSAPEVKQAPPRERRKKNKEKKDNICKRIINSIWTTKYTMDIQDNETKARTILRELILYCVFLAILSAITFSMTNVNAFLMNDAMQELFVTNAFGGATAFSDMQTQNDFWDYATKPLLAALYWETYYNSAPVTNNDRGFIYFENKLLGVPRLRQLRVTNHSCTVYSDFAELIPECYGDFSTGNEDTAAYGLRTETAWVHHTEDQMNGSSHSAIFSTYPGSGYYQDLTHSANSTQALLEILKDNLWIDRSTRAVLLDFSVYNPNVNLFGIARLVVEYPPSGGAFPTQRFRVVKLLRYVTVGDFITLGCEFVFCAFILYYLIEESLEIKHLGKAYFTEFWNLMDVLVILLSLVCIFFNIYRTLYVEQLMEELLARPDAFADFDFLGWAQMNFNYGVGIMCFLAWFKVFKYISFNKTMTQLTDTIARARNDLFGFLVMFMIVFLAFAQLGYLLFGTCNPDYSSILNCVLTLFRIILGDFDFITLESCNTVLGPFYFVVYIVFVFFILFNMFLAIINDSYSEVKAQTASSKNEFEVIDFFRNQYNNMLTKLNLRRDKLADIQKAMLSADANDDNLIQFDEWKEQLLSRGYKDAEIEEAFKKFDVDKNRVLDASEQAAMLKALDEEKEKIEQDIGQVETKLGVREGAQSATPRPKTTRPGKRTFRGVTLDDEEGSTKVVQKKVASEVSYREFTLLSKRVDRMEHSIGSIVSKIDTVLVKLEGMEKAKLKRREAMAKLLDSIAESDDATEEQKRLQMERLVREELARWDSESAVSRPSTAAARPASSARSRPGTGMK